MLPDRPPVSRDLPRADEQAHDHLRYIREVMGRSGPFTAVPGRGLVLMGATALGATALSLAQPMLSGWLRVWVMEAAVGACIGVWALRHKAHGAGLSLRSGPGRKYVQSLLPPMAAGAMLTLALYVRAIALGGPDFYAFDAPRVWNTSDGGGTLDLLPGVWLLLYGTGTVTGGLSSVPVRAARRTGVHGAGHRGALPSSFLRNAPAGAGLRCAPRAGGPLHLATLWRLIDPSPFPTGGCAPRLPSRSTASFTSACGWAS